MYQALLFSFCVLVQVAIGVQWVVLVPACQYTSSDHILALSYIIFLVVFVSLLALRTKHIRDNYRESSYIFVLMVCKVPLWLSWVVCSLVLPDHLQGAASGQFPLPPLLHLCPNRSSHLGIHKQTNDCWSIPRSQTVFYHFKTCRKWEL